MSNRLPAVVIYAALSKASDDPDGASIHTQKLAVRRQLASVYPDGFEVVGEYDDDGYSGSKANRGPGLKSAIDTAIATARDRLSDAQHSQVRDQRGSCEIWANTPARFGRGTSRPGEARAIAALFWELRPEDVALRSARDDLMLTEEFVGIGGNIASQYSSDLGESIKRAKLRQLERGDHLGGPICDGYAVKRDHDSHGKLAARSYVLDPGRVEVVRTIFDLSTQGIPDAAVARRINSAEHRTRHGRPFTRRAIQNTLTNPFYAGRIAYKRGTDDEQVVDGKHPPLVDPAVFDRLQRERCARDYAEPNQKQVGRPAKNHALAKLARCGRCGERLYAVTSNYRRQDGSRARSYVCHAYKFGTGTCDAKPINAEVVDAAVIAGLDSLLVDFEAWRSRIEETHGSERDRLELEVARAEVDYDAQADRTTKVEAKWAEYVAADKDAKADAVLPMVDREREARERATRRLQAAKDALASVPTEAPTDAMLDFANALQAAVQGRVDASGSMGDVNEALRELFAEFSVHETAYAGPVENADGSTGFTFDHPTRKALLIAPFVKLSVVHSLSDAWPKMMALEDGGPPLRWMNPPPERNVTNSQESLSVLLDALPLAPFHARLS